MATNPSNQTLLENAFKEYAKFGNTNSDGKHITLTNIDKWLKEAQVIDGKSVSTTNTGILFQRFKSKTIDFKQFLQFLEFVAKECKLDIDDIKEKLIKCSTPGTSRATKAEKSGVVDRLTDTTTYTGTHKERFDKEGKGKGKAGREDTSKNTGYVQGYKNEDTYDKKT